MAWVRTRLKWPVDPRIAAVTSEVRKGDRRNAELRECLCSRGIVPMSWLERTYDGKGPIMREEGLLNHKAFMLLAHDPARVVTAENLARAIFDNVHFAGWVCLDRVDVFGLVDQDNPAWVSLTRVRGVHPQREVSLYLSSLECEDWRTFLNAVIRQYPAWKPLFELGVIPWLLQERGARGPRCYYILSSAHEFTADTTFVVPEPAEDYYYGDD